VKVVAVVNQKGGAGKTTTTMNLAAVVAESSRVLVVDVDPQQSATWWATTAGDDLPFDFADETDPGFLAEIRSLPYEFVFIDTPGSLSDNAVLSTVLESADFVVVPTEPEALCVPPMVRTIKTIVEPKHVPFRVLLSKVDMRVAGQLEEAEALIDDMGLPRFRRPIRKYKAHADAPVTGVVATTYRESRQTFKAIDDYRAVSLEMMMMWAAVSESRG
jgi:chromosome partitioning protein